MTASTPLAKWLENAPDFHKLYNRLVIVLSILGALLLLSGTREGGLSIKPDAINYMAAARSLASGGGLVRYHQLIPYVHWGPLYPAFLGAVDLLSRAIPLDFIETIRAVNVVMYAVIVFLSGQLFIRYIQLKALALVANVWVVFSFTLFNYMTFPLSESLFYVVTLLLVLYWPRIFSPEASVRHYLILGVLIALIPIIRFAGYSIIPMVMLSIVLFKRDWSLVRRFRLAAMFMLTGLPLFLWLFYGQTTGAYRRLRGDPVALIVDSLQRTPRLISSWFSLYDTYTPLIGTLVVVSALVIIFWINYHYYRNEQATGAYPDLRHYPLLIAQYVFIFLLGLFAAFISVRSPLDARHLSVLYIFVILLFFYTVEQLLHRVRTQWISAGVLILVILVTVFKVERIQHISSIPCCNGDFQREDDLVQWLQQNQLEPGRYLSNTPLPLMYTDLPVFAAPKGLSDWQSLLEQGDTVYLIVFDADDPAEFYRDNLTDYYYLLDFDPLELADLADLKVIADVDRGRVYQLQPRG